MIKPQLISENRRCPECLRDLVFVKSCRGYFCSGFSCRFSKEKSGGYCFLYFDDSDSLFLSPILSHFERKNAEKKLILSQSKKKLDEHNTKKLIENIY